MSEQRFSKTKVANRLYQHIKYLEKKHNFTTSTGYHQVTGKGEEINRDYAEWNYACTVMEQFDLWNFITID